MRYWSNEKYFLSDEERLWTESELELYEKTATVTALEVLRWSDRYSFGETPWWLFGGRRWYTDMSRASREIAKYLEQVFALAKKKKDEQLFCLFLHNKKPEPEEGCMFDHHDDSCCWVLNVTSEQYRILQKAWTKAGLPEDLFVVRPTSQ